MHQGVTKGFHYELAKDFADYLGVKLKVVEIKQHVDTAVERLGDGRYDLLAMSLTQTPERRERLCFSQPFFHTAEVLVQNGKANPVRHPSALNGQAIFIPCSAVSYKKALQHLQDSLNLRIDLIEVDQHFNEDLLHLVETGTIPYTVTDENIARAAGFSMKTSTTRSACKTASPSPGQPSPGKTFWRKKSTGGCKPSAKAENYGCSTNGISTTAIPCRRTVRNTPC